jgi:hypothetical protein
LFLPEIGAKSDAADEAEWHRDAQATIEISEGARLVELSRERVTQESRIASLTKLALRLRNSGDPDGVSFADTLTPEIVAAERMLEQINLALRGEPSSYPPVSGAVVDDNGG